MLPNVHHIFFAIIDLSIGINAMNPLFLAARKIILQKEDKWTITQLLL